jgi:DNA replication protein DnaC
MNMLEDKEIDALPGTNEFKKAVKEFQAREADEIPRAFGQLDPFEEEYKYRIYLEKFGADVNKHMTPAQITKADAQLSAVNKARADEKEKYEALEWERKLMAANVAEMHRGCTFDSYEITDEKQRRYVEQLKTDKKNWFIFCGKTGTGKNHLAAAVIRERLAAGQSAVLWKTKRLMDEQISMSAVEKVQKLRDLEAVDLLILNELGRTSEKKFFQDTIFDLLDERHENNKQTILMTNLTIDELLQLFTPKYASGKDDTSIQRRLQRSYIFEFDWAAWVPRGTAPSLFPVEGKK